MRVVAHFFPSNVSVEANLCEYDPLLGWRGKPKQLVAGEFEGLYLEVQQNSLGFREHEFDPNRREGINPRILFFGDSFIWGFNIPKDRRITDVLESRLGSQTEVLSLGIPGYSTDQELLLYKNDFLNFDADIVVVGLFIDDIFNNGRAAIHNGRYPKPYFTIEEGALRQGESPVPILTRPLLLWQKMVQLKFSTLVILDAPSVCGYFKGWSCAYEDEYVQSSDWELTLKLLMEFKQLAKSRGHRFILVIIPTREQFEGLKPDLPQRELTEFAKREHIEILDILPVFLESKPKELYFKTDLHWNVEGHRIAAEALAELIRN